MDATNDTVGESGFALSPQTQMALLFAASILVTVILLVVALSVVTWIFRKLSSFLKQGAIIFFWMSLFSIARELFHSQIAVHIMHIIDRLATMLGLLKMANIARTAFNVPVAGGGVESAVWNWNQAQWLFNTTSRFIADRFL